MSEKLNRRKMFTLAGAGALMIGAGPVFAGGLGGLGALVGKATGGGDGGGASAADLKGFAASLSKAVNHIAKQTQKLLTIQADYAHSVDLLDLAAKLKAEAANLKKGDTTGASSLKTATKLSESAGKEITGKVKKAASLTDQQKKTLADGVESHAEAIQDMWVGVLETVVVVSQIKKVGKPSINDIEAVKYFQQIGTDAPIALKFGKVSKATYQAYIKAFEAKGVYVAPKNRSLDLKI